MILSQKLEGLGSLLDFTGKAWIFLNPVGQTAEITFAGTGSCCWIGGWRVFTLDFHEASLRHALIAKRDFFARRDWPSDDEEDMCGANDVYLFTRHCEEWIQNHQTSLLAP